MSLTKIGIPSAIPVRTLWDSGAMCSIATQNVVPLGTDILPCRTKLTGATGANIPLLGQATLYLEIGNHIFPQICMIVPTNSITFPQEANLILGSNFLCANRLTLDTQLWAITRNNQTITHLLPAHIDGTLYSPPQTSTNTDNQAALHLSSTNTNTKSPPKVLQTTLLHLAY